MRESSLARCYMRGRRDELALAVLPIWVLSCLYLCLRGSGAFLVLLEPSGARNQELGQGAHAHMAPVMEEERSADVAAMAPAMVAVAAMVEKRPADVADMLGVTVTKRSRQLSQGPLPEADLCRDRAPPGPPSDMRITAALCAADNAAPGLAGLCQAEEGMALALAGGTITPVNRLPRLPPAVEPEASQESHATTQSSLSTAAAGAGQGTAAEEGHKFCLF